MVELVGCVDVGPLGEEGFFGVEVVDGVEDGADFFTVDVKVDFANNIAVSEDF